MHFASRRRDLNSLRSEYELRARRGLEVRWLDEAALRRRYGLHAPAAMLSAKAARVDPYRMTYRLLRRAQGLGAAIFDRTVVSRILADGRGVERVVRSRFLVVAAGYAGERLVGEKVAGNRSSYAFVTDPLADDALSRFRKT